MPRFAHRGNAPAGSTAGADGKKAVLPQRAALWSRCYLDIARAPFLLALVVATAAGLSACGGGSDEGAPGPARTETLVVARADGELTRCVGGDNCEEAPEACEEDAECAGTF